MNDPEDPKDESLAVTGGERTLAPEPDEPPVVARMMIEIRSDGTRTIARGALEDLNSGERVALEAKGTTPMALAASLAKSLLTTPLLAKQAVKALIQSKTRRG